VLNHDWLVAVRDWLSPEAPWAQGLWSEAASRLDAEAQRLRDATGVQVEARLIEGHPVRGIEQVAGELGPLGVVVGARGSTPVHQMVIGTTAERLLRKVSCPLLLVRQRPAQPYQRVLIPLDFSPWSERAVDLALRLSPGAVLVLMHSFTIPFEEKLRFAGVDDATLEHYRERAREDARQQMEAFVQARALDPDRVHLCLTEGDAPQHILTQARERGCDLIVIGKHGRQAAEELLLGSVTKHVVSEASCDVLVSTARQD
jgi:universal stress protein E